MGSIESSGKFVGQDPAAAAAKASGPARPDADWLYQGSCFDAGGFRALREGLVISLIGDDAARVNNPGGDRDSHAIPPPDIRLPPKPGMPVTIVRTCRAAPAAPAAPGTPPTTTP